MKYFRIVDSFVPRDRWHLDDPRTERGNYVDPRNFTNGTVYRGESPLEIPVFRGETALDFTLGSFDMPIVTRRVMERIRTFCGASAQWVPATIAGRDFRVEILNILEVLDAIDEELSEISWRIKKDAISNDVRTYGGIASLVLRRERVRGSRVFRLRGWELPLIVCEPVKAALEDACVTGISYKELLIS